MIRLAQLYTGALGSEVIRRLPNHRELELVAVLVHSADKAGKDSGVLAGGEPNGIMTTQSVDEVLAARPQAAIHFGLWDVDLIARFLRAGVNLYIGRGGFYLRGLPDFDVLDAAGREGNASFAAGGNSPGLVPDVFPLFLSGYTGRVRSIDVRQRNDISTYPGAERMKDAVGIGRPPGTSVSMDQGGARSGGFHQAANMVADALGIECTDIVLIDKRVALAQEDFVLPGSGLLVEEGTVAGVQWKWAARCGDREFLTITNEQVAAVGLGPGWRDDNEEPTWRVEIDGEPPIVATFGWSAGTEAGKAIGLLNVARAMNTIPRLVDARPGCVSVLDFPAVVAGDGLAPE
jgi:hypothetical protein